MNKSRRGREVNVRDRLRAAAMVLLIVCSGPALPQNEPDYKTEFKDILGKVQRQHYTEIKFSKDLPEKWVRRFIADVDQAKNLYARDEVELLIKTYAKKIKSVRPEAIPVMRELYTQIADRAQQTPVLIDSILAGPIDVGDQKYYQQPSTWQANRELEWKLKLQSEIVEWQLSGDARENAGKALSAVYKRSFEQLAQRSEAERFELIVQSLLSVIDPHMSYRVKSSPTDFSEINLMSGIGVTLQLKHGVVEIAEVLKNSPAARSGSIRPGDRIVAIAQPGGGYEAVSGYVLDNVVKSMRGPPGTVVRLRLRNSRGVFETAVTRDKYSLTEEFVRHSLHDITVGKRQLKLASIHLPAFYMDYSAVAKGDPNYRSSARDLKIILEKLNAQGIDGIVLDLRGNNGGSLGEGVDVASLFVGQKPIIQLKYRSSVQVVSGQSQEIFKKPVLVLANEESAGASEIVAAAIQDYGIGLVAGDYETFGLGTTQAADATGGGVLNITLAEYFRATGNPIQRTGVEADIRLPWMYSDVIQEKYIPGSLKPGSLKAAELYRQSFGVEARPLVEKYSNLSPYEDYYRNILALNSGKHRKPLDLETEKARAAEIGAAEKTLAGYGDVEQQEGLKILADMIIHYPPHELLAAGPTGSPIQEKSIKNCSPVTDTGPRLKKGKSPEQPKGLWLQDIVVVVQFEVTEKGSVKNIKFKRSDHPAYAAEAKKAVAKWKFDPAMKEGKPVSVVCSQSMSFGY
jgi:carboxyl-terminal processing protease